MAHIVLLTRGIQQQVDLWKMFMQTQMFWFKRKPILFDKDKKPLKNEDGTYQYGPEETIRVQGALRPMQLWEYVIPSECIPEALAMMNLHKYEELRKEMKPIAWTLRKAMGLKHVDDYRVPEHQSKHFQEITAKYVPIEAVATYPIGIKEDPQIDIFDPATTEGYNLEGL